MQPNGPCLQCRWLSIWTPLFRSLSLGLLGGVGGVWFLCWNGGGVWFPIHFCSISCCSHIPKFDEWTQTWRTSFVKWYEILYSDLLIILHDRPSCSVFQAFCGTKSKLFGPTVSFIGKLFVEVLILPFTIIVTLSLMEFDSVFCRVLFWDLQFP